MIGITDWRAAQCEAQGVNFRYNTFAEAEDVLALTPDVAIIATGGLARTELFEQGNDLVVSAWDILSGDVKPGENVLLFDEVGDYAGIQAAQMLAESGAKLEMMTPHQALSVEVSGITLVPFMRQMQDRDVRFTVTYRVTGVERDGNRLLAHIGSDYMELTQTREVDQVVVNSGIDPLDDLYFDLKPQSRNLGAVDYDALLDGTPQSLNGGPDGFQLFRIGDAVSSRNTHAAILDAFRLMRAY